MKYITINNKLTAIYNILHSPQRKILKYQQLLKYLKDKSPSIRRSTLLRLEFLFNKYLKPVDLIELIYDSNQWLAIEVIRILTFKLNYTDKKIFYRSLEILHHLKIKNWPGGCDLIETLEQYPHLITWKNISFLFDYPNSVFRGYAYYTLRLFPRYKNKLYYFLQNETSDRARIDIYSALYEFGEKQYLKEVIHVIAKTHDEIAQHAGIITLRKYTSKSNFRTILDFFSSEEAKKLCSGAQEEIKFSIKLINKRFSRLLKNSRAGKGF